MAAKVSQLLNGGIRYGKDLKTNGATIEPGLLVQLDSSGSTVSLAGSTAATTPFGVAFGDRNQEYRPTTRVFATNEPLTVVFGTGLFLLSADFFDTGLIPAAGLNLYSQVGGKWSTSPNAGPVIGDVVGTRVRVEPVGGTGANQNLALVRFNIQP